MTDLAKNYIYVDGAYGLTSHGKMTRWHRYKTTDIRSRIVIPSGNTQCFTTVQRYKDAVSNLEAERKAREIAEGKLLEVSAGPPPSDADLLEGQMHYCGVFFDFDCKPKDDWGGTEEERMVTAVRNSLTDARKVVGWFRELGVRPSHVQCWYSGQKGFHVIVRPEVFGIIPHRHLTAIIKMAVMSLADQLDLPTLDKGVYTRARQWRIPNSVHPGAGLFKYELTMQEIMDMDARMIRTRGKVPRNDIPSDEALPLSHVWGAHEYKDILVHEEAATWWRQFMDLYEVRLDMDRLRPRVVIERPGDGSAEFPDCMNDLIDNGPKPTGPNRNKVLLPMVGFMVDAGIEQVDAHKMVADWTTKHFGHQPSELASRIANGRSVVDTGYQGSLHFSCRMIRSNGGKAGDEKVACCGAEKCKWVQKSSDQDPAEVPTVHLSDASRGQYIGTKVRVPVQVAALASAPFGIPLRGKVSCGQDNAKLCTNCACNVAGGKLQFVFSADDARVLELIGVNNNEKISYVRAHCHIPPKCFKNKITYDEQTNLEEVQLIPMVDYSQIYMEEKTSARSELLEDESPTKAVKHVVQRAFHMGHGIQTNKKYMVEASVFNFPKDQRVCLLFDKAELAQNDVDQFVMTPDRYESLKVFRPREGQTVQEKLTEIHSDFTANVHQIGGRMDLSIATDLCYHSVIGFKMDGKWVRKGWWELLVVGDTGTGKSTMIDRMIQHFGLGELTAGEGAGRTGLLFALVQINGQWAVQWGKIPQNDRRLLVIDEFSGIPMEEVQKLTQVRNDGRAIAGGVGVGHETWARTRMIFLTNPREGQGQLSDYNSGIHAVKKMFKEGADLRRVDLAVVVEKNEVSSEMINRRWTTSAVRHHYTSDLCRSLLLWVWSREPHHVEFMEGAEQRIAEHALELGEVYDCDIPLAYKADLRMKIARIAVSVAARLFSTDSQARKVLVTVDHVNFAADFMDFCYRKQSMAYFEYARKHKDINNLTEDRRHAIKKMLMSFDDAEILIDQLNQTDHITKPSLADVLNLPKDDMDKLWRFLNQKGLIQKNYKNWKKSQAFNLYLKELAKVTTNFRGRLGEAFASGSLDHVGKNKELEPLDDFYAGPMPTFEDGEGGGGEEPPY